MAVLIADNHAVEERRWELGADQCGHGALLPIHELCLFKLGIHLGELFHLTPLAKWLREHACKISGRSLLSRGALSHTHTHTRRAKRKHSLR